jgi:hypothetical protein
LGKELGETATVVVVVVEGQVSVVCVMNKVVDTVVVAMVDELERVDCKVKVETAKEVAVVSVVEWSVTTSVLDKVLETTGVAAVTVTVVVEATTPKL